MLKKILIGLILFLTVFAVYARMTMNTTNPDFLMDHFAEIESKLDARDVLNQDVSQVPVAWHLDHCLKTINTIYQALKNSDPEKFEGSFDATRTLSLTMNYIPRGRAQSPTSVRPPEVIDTEDIILQLQEARVNIKMAFDLDENAHFEHPVFGTISRGNTLRFLEVHTEHHLKIIRDILEE